MGSSGVKFLDYGAEVESSLRQNPSVDDRAIERRKKYDFRFEEAEKKYKLPRGLLSAMGYQETRYLDKWVNGPPNSAGAQGLMQIKPNMHKINASDPSESIEYAGKFMRRLLDRYDNDLPKALAGYNWGQGNVSRKGMARMPEETKSYVRDVELMTRPYMIDRLLDVDDITMRQDKNLGDESIQPKSVLQRMAGVEQ
jgi:soluble lytic murein transglycosylase-like protein